MNKLINASHIKFFKEVLDVDVTNVEIIDTNIDEVGTVGLYSKKNKRITAAPPKTPISPHIAEKIKSVATSGMNPSSPFPIPFPKYPPEAIP